MATPRVEVKKPRIDPRIAKYAHNLVENFGYNKMEARELARESCAILDRYVDVMELRIKRLANQTEKIPTQTPYWKARNG
jgi:hypothetical protein